jgi:hypothetical protein
MRGSIGSESAQSYETKIDISYSVVGYQDWFDDCLEPDAVGPGEKIIISSPGDLEPVVTQIMEHKVQGMDTETAGAFGDDGLDPLSPTSEIILMQWGTQDRIYVFQPDLIPYLRAPLQSEEHLLLGQNIVFDFEFILAKYRFALVKMYDTMIIEQAINAGLPGIRVGLKDLAAKYPPHYIITKTVREQFARFRKDSKITRDMLYYSARDVFLLFPIRRGQLVEIKAKKMEKVAKDESQLIAITAEMEGITDGDFGDAGIALDEDILLLSVQPYVERQKAIEEEVIMLYNAALEKKGREQITVMPVIDHFDFSSPSQKLKALAAMGVDIEDVKRETLEALDLHITNLLAEWSECQKITSTYGQNLLDRRDKGILIWRPRFSQMGSGEVMGKRHAIISTGRYSSDFQQMPRPEADYRDLKDKEEISMAVEAFNKKITEIGGFQE